MTSNDLNNHSLTELTDLLAQSTIELLQLMNGKGSDGILIRDKKKDVQIIQEAIRKKKSPN